MERVTQTENATPTATLSTASTPSRVRALAMLDCTSAPLLVARRFCKAFRSLIGCCRRSSAGRVSASIRRRAASPCPSSTSWLTRPKEDTYWLRAAFRAASSCRPSGSLTSRSRVSSAASTAFLLTSMRSLMWARCAGSLTIRSSRVRRALARVLALMTLAASALTHSDSMRRVLSSATCSKRTTATPMASTASTISRPKPTARRAPIFRFWKFMTCPCLRLSFWKLRPAACILRGRNRHSHKG